MVEFIAKTWEQDSLCHDYDDVLNEVVQAEEDKCKYLLGSCKLFERYQADSKSQITTDKG